MRGVLAAFFGALTVAACSAFVGLDGLNVPDEAGTPEGGMDVAVNDTGMKMDAAPDVPSVPKCPSGRGSTMVQVDDQHCIDAYEASYADYLQFASSLDGGVGSVNLPMECAFKTTFVPDQLDNDLQNPVAYIDWCDAWAFCRWAGKDLCGSVDGTPLAAKEYDNPQRSFWMAVCTKDGGQPLPYGQTFMANTCRLTRDPDGGAYKSLVHSGAMAGCVGGYPGIFDMVGNVKEWENACDGTTGANDNCRRRGAGFNELDDPSSNCAFDETYTRNFRSLTSGVRCCAKPQ